MNSKHLIGAILSILIIISAIFYINKGPNFPTPKNSTVVAFGDSLVQGVGATQGNDFVSVVSEDLGIQIVNKGKSGDTTASALARIDEVLELDPGIVLVLLGGNDYLRKVPLETTFGNLETIVQTLQENGTIVVLLGVRGGLLRDTYGDDFKRFAKKHDLIFIPNVLDGLLGNEEYMFDAIHPNDVGYFIIAGRVAEVLRNF